MGFDFMNKILFAVFLVLSITSFVFSAYFNKNMKDCITYIIVCDKKVNIIKTNIHIAKLEAVKKQRREFHEKVAISLANLKNVKFDYNAPDEKFYKAYDNLMNNSTFLEFNEALYNAGLTREDWKPENYNPKIEDISIDTSQFDDEINKYETLMKQYIIQAKQNETYAIYLLIFGIVTLILSIVSILLKKKQILIKATEKEKISELQSSLDEKQSKIISLEKDIEGLQAKLEEERKHI